MVFNWTFGKPKPAHLFGNPAHLFGNEDDSFLPDLCRGQGLLAVIVICELLALLILPDIAGDAVLRCDL